MVSRKDVEILFEDVRRELSLQDVIIEFQPFSIEAFRESELSQVYFPDFHPLRYNAFAWIKKRKI